MGAPLAHGGEGSSTVCCTRVSVLDRVADIRVEMRRFWDILGELCLRLRERYEGDSDYIGLGLLQAIAQARPHLDGDIFASEPQLRTVLSLISEHLEREEFAPLLNMGRRLSMRFSSGPERRGGGDDFVSLNEALSERLYSMHYFLDGGAEEFGHHRLAHFGGGDIEFGLGFRLESGRLNALFQRVKADVGMGAESFFRQYFGEETERLLASLEEGESSFLHYMQTHMILRYDTVYGRKSFELSESMRMHLSCFGMDPLARRAQMAIAAGERMSRTRTLALESGIRSLRGFAMLFDLDKRVSESSLEKLAAHREESDKCLSLADSVLSRMHGRVAQHWQMRLESVFSGHGAVDERYYEESRFFGGDLSGVCWKSADMPSLLDGVSSRPTAGCYYVVRRGDRLRQLTEEAYGTSRDYRLVLRQNPQIRQAEGLSPGMRIYFPKHAQGDALERGDERGVCQAWGRGPKENEPNACQTLDGMGVELLGAGLSVEYLSARQKSILCANLNALSVRQLYRAVCVESDDGVGIACENVALFVSNEENAALYESDGLNSSGFCAWCRRLAAEIRGDAIVGEGRSVPLGRILGQESRRRWVSSSLRRFLEGSHEGDCRVVIHGRARRVEVLDGMGVSVVVLNEEDFAAMRSQPWRRLTAYYAPPLMQMQALVHVWLGDLLGFEAEIVVAPIDFANQYSFESLDGVGVFRVPMGTPVYPIMRGTVVMCESHVHYGYCIVVRHHSGMLSRYSSLSTVSVAVGDSVEAETMMARSGCVRGEIEPCFRLEIGVASDSASRLSSAFDKRMDYFDVVYNCWPQAFPFDCTIASD